LAGAETRPRSGELDDVAVGIAKIERLERAAIDRIGAVDPARAQVVAPGLELLVGVHAQGEVVRRAGAHDARGQLRVLHEAQQRAVGRAEPHVAGVRVVVGGAVVDDAQAEPVAIERDRALQVAGDRRHVVQPAQLHASLVRHAQ
jgi:hypothetical protein